MVTSLIIYLIVALIFQMGLFIEPAYDYKHLKRRDRITISMLFLIWIITVPTALVLIAWERYQARHQNIVNTILNKYNTSSVKNCANQMTLSELKQVTFAHKIRAINLDSADKELVQRSIMDKKFEEYILEDKNG